MSEVARNENLERNNSQAEKGEERSRLKKARENLRKIQQTLEPFSSDKGSFDAESQEGEPRNASLS